MLQLVRMVEASWQLDPGWNGSADNGKNNKASASWLMEAPEIHTKGFDTAQKCP